MGSKSDQIKFFHKLFPLTGILLLAGCLLFSKSARSQNLIFNPGVELWLDTTRFYVYHSETQFVHNIGWFLANFNRFEATFYDGTGNWALNWFSRNQIEFNNGKGVLRIGGMLLPNQGDKVFIQTKLLDSLQAGCFYRFEVFIKPVHKMGVPQLVNMHWSISNSLGFYFSQDRPIDSVSDVRYLFDSHNIQPQVALPKNSHTTDTTQFTQFSGIFQATGGEQYLTIGNFQPSDSIDFYFIPNGQVYRLHDAPQIYSFWGFLMDDFSLTLIPPPDSLLATTADTAHCFGTDLTLTASAQGAQWYQWSTGQTDSSIVITQPGVYWVNAGFNCGFTLSDTIRVSAVPDNPIAPLQQDTVICPNDPVTLRVPWPDALSQEWSTGSTEETITVNQAGTYRVTAQVPCGHQRTANIHVAYDADLPAHHIPLDTTICEGDAFRFQLADGVQYQLDGQPVAPPALEIREPGAYVLSMYNRCFQDEATIFIDQEPCETKHWIPNAFTPNGDGLNDCFGPVITNFHHDSFEFYVSDRWGNIVYQSTDYEACWDGRVNGQLLLATYTWRLVYRGRFNGYQEHYGYVVVLR